MGQLLHPLVRALRSSSLDHPSASAIDEIFDAAEQGGVTPAERRLLADLYQDKAEGWSNAAKTEWASRLANAPASTPVSKPDSGPEAEDLSSRMKTVWMQGFGDGAQESYIADMAKLGAEMGFHIVLQLPSWASLAGVAAGLVSRTGLPVEELDQVVDVIPADEYITVWGEDNKILTNGGGGSKPVKVLIPPSVSDTILTKAEAFTADEGYHKHLEGFQGSVSMRGEEEFADDIASTLGRAKAVMKTYVEGGNMLPGTTSDGEPYALVGRDSVVISAFHLDAKGAFSSSAVANKLEELEAAGELTSSKVGALRAKLQRAEEWTSYWPETISTSEARSFMAKLALTEEIMAKDVGLSPDRLLVITQPEFHIDMHLRPMGPGEVFVQHPAACIEAIDRALEDPNAKAWEKKELLQMRANAAWDLEVLGYVYERIIDELEGAGLIAIRTPGVFRSNVREANFMNGVPGTAKDGETFYLTNASSIKPLERVFEAFTKAQGVDRVEFLGSSGGGPSSWNASELSLSMAGGLECREVDHSGSHTPTTDLADALYGVA